MIRNRKKLEEFYRKLDAEENLSYQEKLALYDAVWQFAVSMGAITSENILDGIEVDIRYARALNSLRSL